MCCCYHFVSVCLSINIQIVINKLMKSLTHSEMMKKIEINNENKTKEKHLSLKFSDKIVSCIDFLNL